MRHLDYPPVWLAGFIVVAVVIARALPAGGFGAWAQLMGPGLVGAGLALMGLAALALWRRGTTLVPHREPATLVTDGVFALSRNPIYLGDVLVLTGVILRLDAVLALPLVPLFVWLLRRRFIDGEEARMRAAFGAEFDAYCRRTRRWL
jgi:protein-S-isoprenylcysteine O-methyltransferase Ste14